MRNDAGSIFNVGRGKWRVQVDLGCDPKTGRRRRPSRTIRGTRDDAKAALNHLKRDTGELLPSGEMTFKDFCKGEWLPAEPDENHRRTTLAEYKGKLERHTYPTWGGVRLCDVKRYGVQRWVDALGRSGLSPQTVVHCYRIFHAALEKAVDWEFLTRNPARGVDLPKVERKELKLPDVAGFHAILAAFAGHELEPLIVVALAVGGRRSELCALTWRDIDFVSGKVSITRGLHQQGRETWYEPPKSRKSNREDYLAPSALAILRRLRGIGPLVPVDAHPMKPEAVSRRYKKRLADAGVPYVQLRNLRHTSFTLALEHGAPLKFVQHAAGHADQRTTERYVHEHEATGKQVAKAMERVWRVPSRANRPARAGSGGAGGQSDTPPDVRGEP